MNGFSEACMLQEAEFKTQFLAEPTNSLDLLELEGSKMLVC